MLNQCDREISKEIYDRAKKLANGYICGDDMDKVFSASELLGYGVYSPFVYEKDGVYYVRYLIGSSCD